MLRFVPVFLFTLFLVGCGATTSSTPFENATPMSAGGGGRTARKAEIRSEAPQSHGPGPRDLSNTDAGSAGRTDEKKERAEASVAGEVNPFTGAPVKAAPKSAESPKTANDTAERPQRNTQGGGGGGGGGGGDAKAEAAPKPKPKVPTVWHRDAAKPTFARVYVGDKNSLELVSLQVSVLVEGPRVRTMVDHVFRNPHDRQLEGTFEYPLPAGASPSYFAMFLGQTRDTVPVQRFRAQVAVGGKPVVLPEMLPPNQLARAVDTADWGKLQEARIVPPTKALEVYEEVTRQRVDPALLEYASGNTFRGRVFPIAPKGYNRVLISYEETLPVIEDRLVYRYPMPTCHVQELRFTLQADAKEFKDPTMQPKDAKREKSEDHILYSRTWSDTKPSGEIVFSAIPTTPTIQATTGRHGEKGSLFGFARLRPEFAAMAKPEPFAENAVFLLDTSLSEHADRFNVSMKLLTTILQSDSQIKRFNVVCFNAAASWLEPVGWIENSKEGREKALSKLDGILLEGATDVSAALQKLIEPGFAVDKKTPIACFVLSDGHATWGETEIAPMVSRFRSRCAVPVRFFCYRTGLGQESNELYQTLTRDGGAIFQCFGEAEIAAAALAHQRQCLLVDQVKFEGDVGASETLLSGRLAAVYPGGELLIASSFAKAGKCKIVVEGRFQGGKFAQSFPMEVRADGELAPRAWGEVAVASLTALNDPWMEDLITAYSQEFNIGSKAASFLILESEEDYKRYNISEEKLKTIKGDLGLWLDDAWKLMAKDPSLKQTFGRLLLRVDERTKVLTSGSGEVKKVLDLLEEEDCVLPRTTLEGAILSSKSAEKSYLAEREKDRRAVGVYLNECERRRGEGDVSGAVRVLSSIIEEHPSRGDALRLVGYRLMDLDRAADAAGLFARVLQQRPFEPHSYRDLARALEDSARYPLAALLYETVLAGTWHGRFGNDLKNVAQEEYIRALRMGLKLNKLTKAQAEFFSRRLESLKGKEKPADLRVSITWNTDATDIDLWVIEPDKTKVFYSAPTSPAGGHLSQDLTQGYGPERYQIPTAKKGEYRILVHYFRANPNLLGGETHVNVTITRYAGTEREKIERKTVILRQHEEQVEVARVRY